MVFKGFSGNVRVLLITCAFLSLSMGIAYPYLSEYIYAVVGSAFIAGLVASARSAVCLIAILAGGFLADFIGRKKPICYGTFLFGLSQLIYACSSSTAMFFLAALCEGISYFYFPAFNAMIMDSSEDRRLMDVFTLSVIVDHLPYTVAPFLGGVLRDFYGVFGLRIGFCFSGFTMLAMALLRWRFLTETLREVKGIGFKELLRMCAGVIGDFWALNPLVKGLVLLRSFVLLVSITMFYYFAVLYAVRYAGVVSFTEWGLILSISSVFYLLAVFFTKTAGEAKPSKSYGLLVLAESASPLLFFLSVKWALLASMAVLNVCGVLTYAIERSYVARVTDQLMRGRAESFMTISFYVGAVIGSLIGGYLFSINPPLLITLSWALLVTGAFLGFMLFKAVEPLK